MIVDISIGKLAEYIEEYNNIVLADNEEVSVANFGLTVPTVTMKATINSFVKKFNLPMIGLEFNNGYSIQVAQNHILQQNGNDIFAKELSVGSTVDHLHGSVQVINITNIKNDDCYDIAIDAPYLYCDANGLVHHNTIITAALSWSMQDYGRTIVIVPNKGLVLQTEEDYINLGLDVGVYFGDRKEFGKQHTICTWQSLNNLLKATKNGEAEITMQDFLEDVVCVMVDEVHMAKAEVLKALLTGAMAKIPVRWGLTGTIPKDQFEAQTILVAIGPVISKLGARELQEKGVLAQCHVNVVQLQDDMEFTNYQSELKHLLEDDKRLTRIAEMIKEIKDTGNTLVLVDRINAGKELVEKLIASGVDAVFVSGGTKLTERKEEYDEIATSTGKVILATYGVASVGINLPRIFNLALIEPGKSFVRVIQSIGRGIRKAEDKDFVQIHDITSSCKFAKRHLTKRKVFYKEASYPFSVTKLKYR